MRPLLTWLAIVGYGLLALGLPLPAGVRPPGTPPVSEATLVGAKDRSVPFPCMNSPCGCASAEQCFRECCCTTLAERLAFAKRHRLDATTVASLEARLRGSAATAEWKPSGSCCADDPATSCCERRPEEDPSPVATCADCPDHGVTAQSREAGTVPMVPPPGDGAGRVLRVTLRAMLACKGIATSWLAVAGAPPVPRFELIGLLPPREWVDVVDVTGEDPLSVPVPPPPRVA